MKSSELIAPMEILLCLEDSMPLLDWAVCPLEINPSVPFEECPTNIKGWTRGGSLLCGEPGKLVIRADFFFTGLAESGLASRDILRKIFL